GNDFANWTESQATPGQTSYQQWLATQNLPEGQTGPGADPDGDGLSNGVEFAIGTSPMVSSKLQWNLSRGVDGVLLAYSLHAHRADVGYHIQKATDLKQGNWSDLDVTVTPGTGDEVVFGTLDQSGGEQAFYRLRVVLFNQY
ncbi:MAG TPA: hypothetical protein VK327_03270, partial [Candidatus Paceibacterota bacterium]|nr:hypothetical protein [Candidatus Paceibacterota bacterium]